MRGLIYGLLVLLLAACGTTGSEQQTLVAFDNSLETERAVVAETATADMESLLFTLDYSALQLTREQDRQSNLRSTLEQRDIVVQLPPTLTPSPSPSSTLTSTPTNPNQPQATIPPTAVIVTPFRPSDTPSPNTATPRPTVMTVVTNIRNVMMAEGVGEDDCATARMLEFSTDITEIYVVAQAFDIIPGMRITSQWRDASGELLAEFDFVPDFAINSECIWFYAEPSDFDFIPGSYTVTLLVNGEDQNATTTFQIVEG